MPNFKKLKKYIGEKFIEKQYLEKNFFFKILSRKVFLQIQERKKKERHIY